MVTQSRRLGVATAAALATVLTAINGAHAADMPMAPPIEAVDDSPVTFASSWYIRGDVGIIKETQVLISEALRPTGQGFPNAWSLGLGMGYKYNSWLRTDLTADWLAPRDRNGNTRTGVLCEVGAEPVYEKITDGNGNTITTGTMIGSSSLNSSCSDNTRARMTNLAILANFYFDLGTWYGFTPYVGAGAGVGVIYQKYDQKWKMNNGVPYNPVWTDPFNKGSWNHFWDKAASDTNLNFAWALMAGVSYELTEHASIDIGYRYLDMGRQRAYSFGAYESKKLQSNQVRIGLRYTPD